MTLKHPNPSPVWQRKMLFTALYFSEGAPIGFIWIVIPVRLRAAGLPVETVTWLQAVLVFPWALKFLWAPMVDQFRSPRWTLRHWICAAQTMMGLTLLPLVWLNPVDQLGWLAAILFLHAIAAATQDVSIDALCIATTSREERGAYNGWMNVGMLLGRATMGGGLLASFNYLGQTGAVTMLLIATLSSMGLLFTTRLPFRLDPPTDVSLAALGRTFRRVLSSATTWWGITFILIAGAAYKSFEAIYNVYLYDRGFDEQFIGVFTAGPMIGSLVVGSILGGWLTDRLGSRRLVLLSLGCVAALIATLAGYDLHVAGEVGRPFLVLFVLIGVAIGAATAGIYALFMNLTQPGIAATQFSTFMGAVNGCESWSVYVLGLIIAGWGFGPALLVMCGVSLLALPMLARTPRPMDGTHDD